VGWAHSVNAESLDVVQGQNEKFVRQKFDELFSERGWPMAKAAISSRCRMAWSVVQDAVWPRRELQRRDRRSGEG